MIKLKRIEKTSYGTSKYTLFINDELIETVAVDGKCNAEANGEMIRIMSRDSAACQKIMSHTIKDFPPVEYFHLKYKFEWTDLIDGIFIIHKDHDTFDLLFDGLPDLSQWKNQFSFDDYCQELSKVFSRSDKSTVNFKAWNGNEHGDQPPGFEIRITIELTEQPIIDEVSKWENIVYRYHTICIDALSEVIRKRRGVLSAERSKRFQSPQKIDQHASKYDAITEVPGKFITLKYLDNDKVYNRYALLIDGIVMENAFARGDSVDNLDMIECSDPSTSRILLNHSISEFPVLLNGIRLKYTFEWTDLFETISVYDARKKGTLITLVAWPDLRKWKNIYSFAEYCDEMTRIFNSKKLDDIELR
jgi:hypothetical protein